MFIPGKEYLPFAVIAPEAKYGKDSQQYVLARNPTIS